MKNHRENRLLNGFTFIITPVPPTDKEHYTQYLDHSQCKLYDRLTSLQISQG